jgi:hypothetical protein
MVIKELFEIIGAAQLEDVDAGALFCYIQGGHGSHNNYLLKPLVLFSAFLLLRQSLHLIGSLNPFSSKNCCSPSVKMKSL